MLRITFCNECHKRFIGREIEIYSISPFIKVCDICGKHAENITNLKTFLENLNMDLDNFVEAIESDVNLLF